MNTSVSHLKLPLTVNFQFIRAGNFCCKNCYATFADSLGQYPRGLLPHESLLAIVRQLSRRITKTTFASGELRLCLRLTDLLAAAKSEGALVNLVNDGSRIDTKWLAANANR